MLLKPCIDCGELSESTRCPEHTTETRPSYGVGYDEAWRKLSLRARQLQPWCTDCGTTHDLTGDHLRWPARGLRDVDVVCRPCNSKRGPVRRDRSDRATGPRSAQAGDERLNPDLPKPVPRSHFPLNARQEGVGRG